MTRTDIRVLDPAPGLGTSPTKTGASAKGNEAGTGAGAKRCPDCGQSVTEGPGLVMVGYYMADPCENLFHPEMMAIYGPRKQAAS